MHKKIFISLLLLYSAVFVQAQKVNVDSLLRLLPKTKTDTGRLVIYDALSNHYNYDRTDSGVYYAQASLRTAVDLNIPLVTSDEYGQLGYSQYLSGDYVAALKSLTAGLSIAEDADNQHKEIPESYKKFVLGSSSQDTVWQRRIARLHYLISFIYQKNEQWSKAITELQTAKDLCVQWKDSFYLHYSLSNLSNSFAIIGRYQEGLAAGMEALKVADHIGLNSSKSWCLAYIGYNYLKSGRINNAKKYLGEALDSAMSVGNKRAPILPYQYLAETYAVENKYDSALFFAHKALSTAQAVMIKSNIIPIDTLLSAIHHKLKNFDSAYYYLKAADLLRQELLSGQKNQELQSIVESENKRVADLKNAKQTYAANLKLFALGAGILLLLIAFFLVYRNNRAKQRGYILLQQQKAETENALLDLKNTQQQLVQAEKMASLGELTAGIAHEIQNPLNFVNNFSDMNVELSQELIEEIDKGNTSDAKSIAEDIAANAEKINHHGKRADSIVKGMLQHSRTSAGVKESTDINALCDEYLRLSYHGLRAKEKPFNAELKTDFDNTLPPVNVIPQEIGRVLLNLFNNAFYAVNEKKKSNADFHPVIEVSTFRQNNNVCIVVKDNGSGIPEKILNKIWQPFFTTKPTGEGTGLGLSLSYDIIKKVHAGEMQAQTVEGESSTFIIQLPIN